MEPSSSLTLTNPAHGSSRATNENTAIFYIPPIQPQHFCVENTKAITLTPQPLKLDIYTATADFRHDWQKELRTLVAKFISVSARIHYELESNPDYLNSSESNGEYSQLIETNAKIKLMLDRSKPYALEISNLTSQLIMAVKKHEIHDISQLSDELLKVANGVLEQAWLDIRKDLRGKK